MMEEAAKAAQETVEQPDVVQELKDAVAPTLQPLTDVLKSWSAPLDRYLGSLDAEVGRYCAVVLFGIVLVWVFTLKRDYIFQGAPDRARWRDLRLWSLFVTVPYVVIYLFLF